MIGDTEEDNINPSSLLESNFSKHINQLIIDQLIDEVTLELILERMKQINFHDKEEMIFRRIIQSLSKSTNKSLQTFLGTFFILHTSKTNLFLILIDEISKQKFHKSVMKAVLSFSQFMVPDENMLKFYSSSIKILSMNTVGSLKLIYSLSTYASKHQLLDSLYPEIKSNFFESEISNKFIEYTLSFAHKIQKETILIFFDEIGDFLRENQESEIYCALITSINKYAKRLKGFDIE
jgi:hypothetical protein